MKIKVTKRPINPGLAPDLQPPMTETIADVKTYVINPQAGRDWLVIDFNNGDKRRIDMSEILDWTIEANEPPKPTVPEEKPEIRSVRTAMRTAEVAFHDALGKDISVTFSTTPKEVAASWSRNRKRFEAFLSDSGKIRMSWLGGAETFTPNEADSFTEDLADLKVGQLVTLPPYESETIGSYSYQEKLAAEAESIVNAGKHKFVPISEAGFNMCDVKFDGKMCGESKDHSTHIKDREAGPFERRMKMVSVANSAKQLDPNEWMISGSGTDVVLYCPRCSPLMGVSERPAMLKGASLMQTVRAIDAHNERVHEPDDRKALKYAQQKLAEAEKNIGY